MIQHLRQSQASYLKSRGYSYGYGHVIGPNPIDWDADPVRFDVWEVRGFDIRVASNNGDVPPYSNYHNPNFNGRSWSQQIVASASFPATDDQIEQARWMIAIADVMYGETLTVIPHRTSDLTSCPGDYLASKIPYIATRPTTPTPPPEPIPPVPIPVDPTKGTASMGAPLVLRYGGTPTQNWSGYFSFDGVNRQAVHGMHHAKQLVRLGALDARTLQPVEADNWSDVTHTTNAEELDEWLTPGRD